MTIHTWKGHELGVESYAIAKTLWICIGLALRVDGSLVATSPDRWEGFRTRVPFEILDGGTLYRGQVKSGYLCSPLRMSYQISINNENIAAGAVRAKNWYATYSVLVALGIAAWVWLSSSHW